MERDMQRPRLRRSMIGRRRRTWTPSAGRWSCFFSFFSTSSSNQLRFAFLALKVASKLLLERFRSAWQKSITFFAAHLAESSLRGVLTCRPLFGVLHRSCTWLSLKSSALPSAGFVRRLESLSWKARLGPQFYSICYFDLVPEKTGE